MVIARRRLVVANDSGDFDEIEKLTNKTRGAGAMRVMGVTP